MARELRGRIEQDVRDSESDREAVEAHLVAKTARDQPARRGWSR